MSRFEVEVTLLQRFVFAIESADAIEAQSEAIRELQESKPEETKMKVNVQKGVR